MLSRESTFELTNVTAAFARYQRTALAPDQQPNGNGENPRPDNNQLAPLEVTMPDTVRDNSSTTPSSTTPAAPAAEESTPAQKLKEAKQKLDQNEADLKQITKTRDENKSDVDTLTKVVAEIDGVSEAFKKAKPGIDEDLKNLNAYNDAKTKMVEEVLGDEKKTVDEKIKAVDTAIQTAKTDLDKAETALPAKEQEATKAQQDLDKAQQAYNSYKNLPADLGDAIQKVKDLKTKVEKAEDESKPAVMYVYLQEQDALLQKIDKVPSQEDFEKKLNELRNKLDVAQDDAQATKQALESAKDDVAKKQKAFGTLTKSRLDDILKKVEA